MWADSAALGGGVVSERSSGSIKERARTKGRWQLKHLLFNVVCGIYEIDLQTGNATEALRLKVLVCKSGIEDLKIKYDAFDVFAEIVGLGFGLHQKC